MSAAANSCWLRPRRSLVERTRFGMYSARERKSITRQPSAHLLAWRPVSKPVNPVTLSLFDSHQARLQGLRVLAQVGDLAPEPTSILRIAPSSSATVRAVRASPGDLSTNVPSVEWAVTRPSLS